MSAPDVPGPSSLDVLTLRAQESKSVNGQIAQQEQTPYGTNAPLDMTKPGKDNANLEKAPPMSVEKTAENRPIEKAARIGDSDRSGATKPPSACLDATLEEPEMDKSVDTAEGHVLDLCVRNSVAPTKAEETSETAEASLDCNRKLRDLEALYEIHARELRKIKKLSRRREQESRLLEEKKNEEASRLQQIKAAYRKVLHDTTAIKSSNKDASAPADAESQKGQTDGDDAPLDLSGILNSPSSVPPNTMAALVSEPKEAPVQLTNIQKKYHSKF